MGISFLGKILHLEENEGKTGEKKKISMGDLGTKRGGEGRTMECDMEISNSSPPNRIQCSNRNFSWMACIYGEKKDRGDTLHVFTL